MICGPEVSSLISVIYPTLQGGLEISDKCFLEHAILCCRNTEVDEINQVLKQFPGEERFYSSADSMRGVEDGEDHYPVEYLNSINTGGLTPSQLRINFRVPLMLLWNLDVGCGLYSGTRLHLVKMTNRVLLVRIILGLFAGETSLYSQDNCVKQCRTVAI